MAASSTIAGFVFKKAAPKQKNAGDWESGSVLSGRKADDKKKGAKDRRGVSPSPAATRLDDLERDSFDHGRPLEDPPDMQLCKHCKKSVLGPAAREHIAKCLRIKKEKAQRKKEAREKREREKEAAREKEAWKAGEETGIVRRGPDRGKRGGGSGAGGGGSGSGAGGGGGGGGSGGGGGGGGAGGDDNDDSDDDGGGGGAGGGNGGDKKEALEATTTKTAVVKKTEGGGGSGGGGGPVGKKRKADGADLDKGPSNNKKKKKDEPKPKAAKARGPVDVERQCGVALPNGQLCARSLTCKTHSMGAKRAVPGRSLPYDILLSAYQKKNQAKQQKAALDASAPVEDEEAAAVVDSDEETAAVMNALALWNPQPAVPQPVFAPIKRQYQLARLHEQLMAATNSGRVNIFKVSGFGAQKIPPAYQAMMTMTGGDEGTPAEPEPAMPPPFSRRSSVFSQSGYVQQQMQQQSHPQHPPTPMMQHQQQPPAVASRA